MGAKQSKRSVDISGKEAESAGEVAAAGAGGEGRVEQLADADALKTQLNGDAHIQESSDKEKQGSETPEIEKDVTTEKEDKVQEDEKKEAAPVTNGEAEQKTENGEALSPEENKKPKKEKVKKKWSLRSISFSRKDKPKQEKKQKDEEKTNGEPEKVPEEVAETTPESDNNEVPAEKKSISEVKEDKTPETPVTEPITNGSSTPETPKSETAIDEPVKPKSENEKPESKVEPEQLPVNALTLDESQKEVTESLKNESCKPEEISVEPPVPATEIPVKNEVCVEQMPLIEPTPPPLPAIPPPSSVASFAATTMAPELTNASLANSADIVTDSSSILETNTDITIKEIIDDAQCPNTQSKDDLVADLVSPPVNTNETPIEPVSPPPAELNEEIKQEPVVMSSETSSIPVLNEQGKNENNEEQISEPLEVENTDAVIKDNIKGDSSPIPEANENDVVKTEDVQEKQCIENDVHNSVLETDVNNTENVDNTEIENLKNKSKDSQINLINTNECNTNVKEETVLTNGDSMNGDHVEVSSKAATTLEDSLPPSLSEVIEILPTCEDDVSNDASESFPLPPSELCPSESEISQPGTPERNGEAPTDPIQETLLASDKMADLIPEVPVIPELNTELETTTDVAIAN